MKKIKRLLSIASLVFIFCSVSYSQNTPPKDPFDFLILVMDSNKKIDEWFNTPFSHGVKINTISKASVNQPVNVAFIMSGLEKNTENFINTAIDVKITDPNGKVLFETKKYDEKYEKIEGPLGVQMAEKYIEFGIEPGDPTGVYVIEATLHDKVSKKEITKSYKINFG